MRKRLFVVMLILLSANFIFSETITTFIPVREQSCRITINIPDFEPWDMLMSKAILAGSVKGDMNITITVEKTEVDTKPAKIRDIYGNRAFEHSGLEGSEKILC